MTLFKFIVYSLIAFLVIRFVMRLISPPRNKRNTYNRNPNFDDKSTKESLEKPKFTIKAESVDYEIIEESKKKNEE